MAEIPEHLLQRSAEAKAKALGIPVEQVLAEMKGEAPPAAETPDSSPQTPAESTPDVDGEAEETPDASPQTPAEPTLTETPDTGPETPAELPPEVEALSLIHI